jgi:hypothetical protein
MSSEALELFFFCILFSRALRELIMKNLIQAGNRTKGQVYFGAGVLWCIFTKAHRIPTKIPISTKQQT